MWFDISDYQEFIDYCMELGETSTEEFYTYASVLIHCGYKSALIGYKPNEVYLDDHEFTHFVLRWS